VFTVDRNGRSRSPECARRIKIVDIGLQPWDAISMGLSVEEGIKYKKRQPVAEYVRERFDRPPASIDGKTWDTWEAWLQKNRVELNAMTPRQMIEWLDRNIEKSGELKVVPPSHVAVNRLRDSVEDTIREQERDRVLAKAEEEIEEAAAARIAEIVLPEADDLVTDIKDQVMEHRSRHWTNVIARMAVTLTRQPDV
jgi:hypothetical protein